MFRLLNALLITGLIAALGSSQAAAADAWRLWHRELKLWCPSHHVDWICEDCYIDLIEDFNRTLPKRLHRKVTAIADTSHPCANEVAGFSCEMTAHLIAVDRLGLMTRFARFGCRRYRCSEGSVCTRA
jgi:hypothetical protein